MLASSYVNTKHLEFSAQPADYINHRDIKELYQRTSVSFGINHTCTHISYVEQMESMIRAHRYIQENRLTNILEVSLEDFEKDYDHTTRSIFVHFLGKNDSRVDRLVEITRYFDIARFPP